MNNCIFTVVDKNYESYARACFNSIVKNYPHHPTVLVYYEDLSDEFKEYVTTLYNFELVYKKLFDINGLNLGPVGNRIVYKRYLLWSNEFDCYDNILHLDVDTLVLDSLDELFDRNEFLIFDNNEILDGVDLIEKTRESQDALNSYGISYNVFNPPSFANAGIFTIPKRYRTKEQLFNLISISKKLSPYLKYADQSAINMWMIENSIPVSNQIEYNFQPHFFNYKDNKYELEDVKIIHFAAKKVDTIQFVLWWRMKNLGVDFYNLYKIYLNMKKNNSVIVSGHRRSGTHLLTDILVNVFKYDRAEVDIDDMQKSQNFSDIEKYKENISKENIVFWTHCESKKELECLEIDLLGADYNSFINTSKIIYIYRDGRDVLTSYYHMKNPEHDIKTFLTYTSEGWENNILGWINEEHVLKISYEDIINDYESVVRKISDFISKPIINYCDLRINSTDKVNPNLKYSFREFRKGIIGDYKNNFSQDDINKFNKRYGHILDMLGYER